MMPVRLSRRLPDASALPAPLARRATLAAELFLHPVAGIVLVRGAWAGALMWLALAAQPRLLLSGVLGILVGEAVRRLSGNDDITGHEGCLKANAFLAAVATGWMTGPAGLSLIAQAGLVAAAAGLAAVLAAAIRHALENTSLPPLVWAYCVVASFYFLVFPDWTYRAILTMDWGSAPVTAADWVMALLRSLGALVFSPTPWAGLLMAGVILAWSRLMFVCGLVGWIAGVLAAQSFLKLGDMHYWLPTSYNFFLAGMALGTVQYLPSRGSLPVAAAAGAFAAVAAIGLQHLFGGSPAAYLPIPLGLTVWIGIGALLSAEQRGVLLRNPLPSSPPEEAWRGAALEALRWGSREPLLGVPLAGTAEVTQGFSGKLSHAGRWRHALDLQRPATDGSSDARPSLWEAAVYAPAAGVVEHVRNDVADNPLGVSNFQENWGNHVIIRLDQGGWAMLAHLKQWSIPCAPGMRVVAGSQIGLVGNSGRSPTPHLHIQAQRAATPGAMTARFRVANFLTEAAPGEGLLRWHAAGVPPEGTVLAAALADPAVRTLLTGMVPGQALWSVEARGKVPASFAPDERNAETIEVFLDDWGRHHHAAGRGGGEMVSRADADAWRMISITPAAAPLLRLLALAMPSVPYAARPGLIWHDRSPLCSPDLRGGLAASFAPLLRDPFVMVECRCLATPGANDARLTLHSEVLTGGSGLPLSVRAELDAARGCVSVSARFEEGALTFEMLSFAPGVPLRSTRAPEEASAEDD
ncbi:urea transporter [Falsiroseomonas oryziterrae]|uniref:urea transporter n=1 Tax=Falsiroseomonas oryziterrae TaxID=2911368 RepID=UPI001F029BA5|nr:urea transporter [Roseomonas sp. NPKOSM-4]